MKWAKWLLSMANGIKEQMIQSVSQVAKINQASSVEQAGCPPTNMVQFEENQKIYLG